MDPGRAKAGPNNAFVRITKKYPFLQPNRAPYQCLHQGRETGGIQPPFGPIAGCFMQ